MENLRIRPRVQVFATDIDDRALTVARSGRYPLQLLSDLSDDRRKRHFRKDGATAVISKEIRELCVFSPHNLVSDPPFSRMDMVSCRNLLIYFNRDLQDQVIPTFHYALKPGGYLFLGTSESISQHADLFAPVEQKQRIFQSRGFGTSRPRLPMRLEGMEGGLKGQFAEGEQSAAKSVYHLKQRVETLVLERHAPAHVVVRSDGDIVYYSARTGRYLEMPRGAPNRHLLELARKDLRLELRAAFRDALENGGTFTRRAIMSDRDDGLDTEVWITVEALSSEENAETLFLVLFSQGQVIESRKDPESAEASEAVAHSAEELRDMRERLQSTIEEYETALEELRSSNEELVSVNEEAQSTNEELEASKEEMQSLNEELTTINVELTGKVVELDQANADLKNLYAATKIASVFLDSDLVIRNFTPGAASLFNLREADIGRPLTELASATEYPDLQQNIRWVFENNEMFEQHLTPENNGDHYLLRLVPYRNEKEVTTGVVVTLVDITNLAKAEAHQRVLIEELNHRVKNMLAVVISITKATWRHTSSPEQFMEALEARLHAMARTYALLSNYDWDTVTFKELLEQELEPFDDRFVLSGPKVDLPAEMSLALGLVIHELATNAAKYGAFSTKDGCIEVDWTVAHDALKLNWRETGGPPVSEPKANGFGFLLIDGQISHRLGGKIEYDYADSGLAVELEVPLES